MVPRYDQPGSVRKSIQEFSCRNELLSFCTLSQVATDDDHVRLKRLSETQKHLAHLR